MKKKKLIFILGIIAFLGAGIFGGLSINNLKPVSTGAQTSSGTSFNTINALAKSNNQVPTLAKSEDLAGNILDGLSTLYIPKEMQGAIVNQVATAHLNGVGAIDENNIVNSVNTLVSQANAPAYAYTNVEQVKVVRKLLNRLMPALVAPSGQMSDLEAFAVFVATVSQKTDNDAFMVTPAEFTASMNNPVAQPFPGSTAAGQTTLSADSESAKSLEMLRVIEAYLNNKNRISNSDMISMIGIN